jgi:MFS family permease
MASFRQTLWRYYAYRATTSIGFYVPVGVAFLVEARDFGLDAIGTIMAVYLLTMLVAEIPTGYLGDRIGRRASLAVGNALMTASLLAWAFLQTPLEYALVNVAWATGTTFRSGTASAWLYEYLAAHDHGAEFARISGRAATVRLVVSAVGAVTAGGLVALDWSYPFLANAALAALGLPLLATLPAVGATDTHRGSAFTVDAALKMLRVQAGRPDVRWFVAYAALFYGLFQLALAFEQPAIRELGIPITGLGVLYAGFKLVSAGAASTAGWLEARVGTRTVFALYAPIIGLVFAAVAVWPLALVPALFVTRAGNAATRPLRNQYLNDRLEDVGRATVLSGASMVLSVVAATADVLGGVIAETTGPVQFLTAAGLTTAGAATLLWLAVTPVRTQTEDTAPTPASAPMD